MNKNHNAVILVVESKTIINTLLSLLEKQENIETECNVYNVKADFCYTQSQEKSTKTTKQVNLN